MGMLRPMLAVHAPSLSRLSFVILIGTADLLGLSVPDPVSAQANAAEEALLKEAEDILQIFRNERAKPESQQSLKTYDELKRRIDVIWTAFMRASRSSERGQALRVEIGTASDWLRKGPANLEQEQRALEQQRRREAVIKEQEEKRQAAIKAQQWPIDIETAVLDKQVLVGMTTEQATMAWGRPTRVNETVSASGKAEEWVYPKGARLHFVNGELRVIQTSR
jgi:hypothetical protein